MTSAMSAADNCRAKAAKLFAKAETESNQTVRAEFENLAEAFLRVAEQAERDAAFAAETELPSPKFQAIGRLFHSKRADRVSAAIPLLGVKRTLC